MRARSFSERIKRFARVVYLKLFRINDTPQKIAIGFGLGVFAGVLPGAGPLAALFLAFLFRVNRASALLGSLITNTWISVVALLAAIKAGALLTGVRYQDIRGQWDVFIGDFRWDRLLSLSAYKIVWPVMAGFVAVALCIGIMSYAIAFFVLLYVRRNVRREKD